MKISTVCDSNFVDKRGLDCNWHVTYGRCQKMANAFANGEIQLWTHEWSRDLSHGVMSDEGLMTQFNCPQCGCGENGPIFRFDNL